MYVVIVAPPLAEGAVYATVAVVEPVDVAVPIVGASGTFATTVDVELEFADTPPGATEFVAVTTHRMVVPT